MPTRRTKACAICLVALALSAPAEANNWMVKAQRELTCSSLALPQERASLGVTWFPEGRAASAAEMRRLQSYVTGAGTRDRERLFRYLSLLAGFAYQADYSNDQYLRTRFESYILAHSAPGLNYNAPEIMTQIFLCTQTRLMAAAIESGDYSSAGKLGSTIATHYAKLSLAQPVTDWPLIRALRVLRTAPNGNAAALRELTDTIVVRATALQQTDPRRAGRLLAEAAAGRHANGNAAEAVATGAMAIGLSPPAEKGSMSWIAFPPMYDGLKATQATQPPTAADYTQQVFSSYDFPADGQDYEREFDIYARLAELFRDIGMDNTNFWVIAYNRLRLLNHDVVSHEFLRQGLARLSSLTDKPVDMLLGTLSTNALHPSEYERARQLYEYLLGQRQQTVVMDSKAQLLFSFINESILHSLSRMRPRSQREQALIADLAFRTLQLDSFTRLSVAAASTGVRKLDMPRDRRFHLERFYTYTADHSAWLDATGLRVAVMPGQDLPGANEVWNVFMTISTFQNETEAELGQYYDILQRFAPGAYAMTVPFATPLKEFQDKLASDEAVVASVLGTNESYMFAIRNNSMSFSRTEPNATEFGEAVAALRASVAASGGGDSLSVPPYEAGIAHTLFVTTLGKVTAGLQGASHIYWYGDGALGSVPPAILVSSQPPRARISRLVEFKATRFLVDEYSLSSVPDLFLGKTDFLNPDNSNDLPQTFAGFGAPLLSNEELAQDTLASSFELAGGVKVSDLRTLAKLPAAKTEIESLSAAFSDPQTWLGEAASEQQLRELDLRGFDVIAFATHGFTRADIRGQVYPSLLMAPPASATNSANDGLLTTLEIGRLQLDADLVLLSACNTARSDGRPDAEAFSGLAQAFMVAGARSLLVSHWPVASGAASELSVQTVQDWKKGASLRDSLQASIQRLRTGASSDLEAHPFFWGPFVLANDGGSGQ